MPVDFTCTDGIATLTLNRPEARNALDTPLIQSLAEGIMRVRDDASARVLILAGAGKSFCAGMDLRGVMSDPVAMGAVLRSLAETTVAIRNLGVPTIAAVQGAAIGGGCGLMVVCDYAITHPEAKLGYPEVELGISPAVVAPWLIRKIGAGPARSMLLRGGTMSGTEAFDRGLADRLVDAAAVAESAQSLAREIASGGSHALAVTKRWLNELDGSWQAESVLRGAELSANVILGEEAQRRLRAKLG